MAKKKKFGNVFCQCHTVFSAEYGKSGTALECRCVDQHTQERFTADEVTLIQTRKQRIRLK